MDFLLPEDEALYNGRVKLYPDGNGGETVAQVLVCSRPIFNPHRLELTKRKPPKTSRITPEVRALWDAEDASAAELDRWDKESNDNEKRAKRRAKQRVFDLAACSGFDLFITLTLNAAQVDRYDYKGIVRKLGQWLDNRVRRQGLRYVIVPEYHKDGAIHFHGLINSQAVKLDDSGHRYRDGRVIYNLPEWNYGWTTAIRLTGDYAAVCGYICKYVTKQSGNIGGRYYLSGGQLGEPRYQYFNADYESTESVHSFDVADGRISFKVVSNKCSNGGGNVEK